MGQAGRLKLRCIYLQASAAIPIPSAKVFLKSAQEFSGLLCIHGISFEFRGNSHFQFRCQAIHVNLDGKSRCPVVIADSDARNARNRHDLGLVLFPDLVDGSRL